jgi:hypothetical protein
MLAFGPDGYLYVGLGDGGSAGDPENRAQDLGSLLGKLLRIDVDGAAPYAVPTTNPFVGRAGARGEIWALGLRNPWRYSFDRATGDLWIGDVGQGTWEEIDRQAAGGAGGRNFQWSCMEGAHTYSAARVCSQGTPTGPLYEYGHGSGDCSVTGGYVYRGGRIAALAGAYVFGDYCSGRIWALAQGASGAWAASLLLDTGLYLASFGQDAAGELYVVDLGGAVYRLDAANAPTPTASPGPPPTSTATAAPTPTPPATPTPVTTPKAGPDLVITRFTATDGSTDAPPHISVTVQNRGDAEAGPGDTFDVHVFADLGRPPVPGDTAYVAHLAVAKLAVGASATVEGELFSGMLSPGPHTLWALADGHDVVAESVEENNHASASVAVSGTPTPTAERPSARFSFEDGTTQGWQASGPLTAAVDARSSSAAHSDGARSLAVTLSGATESVWGSGYYASPPDLGPGSAITAAAYVPPDAATGLQARLFVQDRNGTWYDAPAVAALMPGSWRSLDFTVPPGAVAPFQAFGVRFYAVPGATWNGQAYIDAVDYTGATATPTTGPTVTPAATPTPTPTTAAALRPDLVVTSLIARDLFRQPETRVRIGLRNRGSAAAGAFRIHLYDDTAAPRRLLLDLAGPPLATGQSAVVYGALPNGTLEAGSHRLLAVADATGVIAEVDEGNNARATTFVARAPGG